MKSSTLRLRTSLLTLAVPEPASGLLLALGGAGLLAARRRRIVRNAVHPED